MADDWGGQNILGASGGWNMVGGVDCRAERSIGRDGSSFEKAGRPFCRPRQGTAVEGCTGRIL